MLTIAFDKKVCPINGFLTILLILLTPPHITLTTDIVTILIIMIMIRVAPTNYGIIWELTPLLAQKKVKPL